MADEAEVLEPSTETNSQGVDEPSPSSDVEASLEDAIRDALQAQPDADEDYEPEDAEEDSSPQDDEATPEAAEAESESEPEPEPEDPDEAFLKMLKDNDVPLGKIDRFKELIQERNTLRQETEEAENIKAQIASIELAGKQLGLDDQQVGNLFASLVVMQEDPDRGFQMLNEVQTSLASKLGHELPSDLREKVDDGYLDEETARRIAIAEARADLQKRSAEQLREQQEVERRAMSHQAITESVNSYHKQIRESDPDYADPKIAEVKDRMLRQELAVLVQIEGQPDSVEKARALAEKAYEATNHAIKALRPAPQATQRSISGRGSVKTTAAQPKSMLEAITAAVQNP